MSHETNEYCYYCFEPVEEPGVCPACGKDADAPVPESHLEPGTWLKGRFIVGRALGQDANGIVYAVMDNQTNARLRIREYLPRGMADRQPDGTVDVLPGSEGTFQAGLDAMRASTETGDGARRRIFFEDNGTGYLVQRKLPEPVAGNPEEMAGEEEPIETKTVTKQMFIMGAVVCVMVVGILAVLLNLGRNALDPTRNVSATASPTDMWVAPTPINVAVTASPDELGGIPSFSDVEDLPTAESTPTRDPYAGIPDDEGDDGEGYSGYDDESEEEYVEPTVKPTRTPRPTARPTPEPEEEDEEIDYVEPVNVKPSPTPVQYYRHASADQLEAFQWRMIELGWLQTKEPSRKYDLETRNAIRDFQNYVNKNYGAGLTADGDAGPKTIQWIDDMDAPTRPAPTPAPTPKPTKTPKPTEEPTPKPTKTPKHTPTPEPYEPEEDEVPDDEVYEDEDIAEYEDPDEYEDAVYEDDFLSGSEPEDDEVPLYEQLHQEQMREQQERDEVPMYEQLHGGAVRMPEQEPEQDQVPQDEVPEEAPAYEEQEPEQDQVPQEEDFYEEDQAREEIAEEEQQEPEQDQVPQEEDLYEEDQAREEIAEEEQQEPEQDQVPQEEDLYEEDGASEEISEYEQMNENIVNQEPDAWVKDAQQKLHDFGWMPEYVPDGLTSPEYTEALEAFQRGVNETYGASMDQPLNEEGLLDQATWDWLNSADAPIHVVENP